MLACNTRSAVLQPDGHSLSHPPRLNDLPEPRRHELVTTAC